MGFKNLIYILIIYTLAIILILLFSKKKKHISVLLLGFYSATQIICVGNHFLYVYYVYISTHAPQLFFVSPPFLFLLVPLFFLFIKTSVNPGNRPGKQWIYHFLPFLAMLIYYMVNFWFRSKEYIDEWHQIHLQAARIRNILITIFFNIQYLFYCIWLMIMLNGIKKNRQILLHSVFNNFLLKVTIYLYAGGWVLSIVTFVIGLIRIMPGFDFNFLNILYFYFFFLFLFYITVKGYNTKEIFKYSNSETDHDDLVKLYEKIVQTIMTTEPFLEPLLSLKQFADSIKEDPRQVSQAINHVFGSNFNDYMNYHRVELSKKMLGNRPDLTIQEVMYQSGFNSKATFNKVFKKFIDKTPSQFRNEAQSNTTV